MPPKPVSVDGIKPKLSPPAVQPNTVSADVKKELQNQAIQANANPKNQVKTSKADNGPALTILVTIIFMVALIALAYFAYNKSK